MIALIAHTCLEATARFGAELGYQVTVVKDPHYATAVVSTDEVLYAISQAKD